MKMTIKNKAYREVFEGGEDVGLVPAVDALVERVRAVHRHQDWARALVALEPHLGLVNVAERRPVADTSLWVREVKVLLGYMPN